jgi:CAAX prenyl protease-like protein
MDPLTTKLRSSPTLARVAPFVIFLLLTFCQGQFGPASNYWFYLIKTVVGAWLVWSVRDVITEMKWAFSWEAVAVGVAVCVMWVGIDAWYPKFGKAGAAWNPNTQFGAGSALAWFFVVVRIAGSTIVVPPLEEVFYRSFLYRYLVKPEYLTVSLGAFNWTAFLLTSAIFGASHYEWLAGTLCGFAYQGLVGRKQRLGDAMTAHAITNFLLGLWVVGRNAWNFW